MSKPNENLEEELDNELDVNFENYPKSKKSFGKSVLETLMTVAFCLAIAIFIDTTIIVNAKVPSSSMETTVMTNDRLFANRLAYVNSTPERGDVVVFKAPDEPETLYIKRVIGIPGDTIQIVEGELYLNNELQNEPYINEPMVGDFGPYYVPEDCYFMMGDNRNHSADSRYWVNTFVPEDYILGKAMFTYYPKIHDID